ncbi:carboxypeptidase-like regulatory domain-containing protein [Bacteroidota bacterium]
MRKNILLQLLIGILVSGIVQAGELTQTIRGKVIDQDSNFPVIGANVIIVDSDPILGSATDLEGNFRIDDVPLGRVTLVISCLGFEDKTIPNIKLTSTKESVIDISMQESVLQLDELVVQGNQNKSEVLNDLAMISARTFSVEETKRYAGSFNDPARMVASFAGVNMAAEGDNYIAVRGNSPKGIQWRLEGIEIPNPNHFSDEGGTGGPINMLSSYMLSNSDFLSGAFPADYGNAYSGVFDMKMRNGNNEKREHSVSVGVLGIDLSSEGPFKKGEKASYLANYRYSSLGLMDDLNLVDFGGVPRYQDLSFKVNIPTNKAGTFTFFGLGGKSGIIDKTVDEGQNNKVVEIYDYKTDMGFTGLKHVVQLNKNMFLENIASVSENGSGAYGEELNDQDEFIMSDDEYLRKYSVRYGPTFHAKINKKNKVVTGLHYTHQFYDFRVKYFDNELEEIVTAMGEKGNTGLIQAFGSWKWRISNDLTLVSGLHYMRTTLNDSYSIEPRIGLKWAFAPAQSLSLGYGVHSKMESLLNYFAYTTDSEGNRYQPNLDMEFPKARHFVIGYDNMFTPNLYLKMEAYYQDLYNVGIENDPNSSFSMLNRVDWFTTRDVVNKGTGYNFGIELTLEKYFSNNYYYLLTGSLFESKYKGMDGVERNSRFNANYIGNLLIGKEFSLGVKKGKSKSLNINSGFTLTGPRWSTPIDLEASRDMGYTVRKEEEAYSVRGDDIFIGNLSVNYRINKKKSSQELKFEVRNFTNNQGEIYSYYSGSTDEIEHVYQLAILPVIYYTVEF